MLLFPPSLANTHLRLCSSFIRNYPGVGTFISPKNGPFRDSTGAFVAGRIYKKSLSFLEMACQFSVNSLYLLQGSVSDSMYKAVG